MTLTCDKSTYADIKYVVEHTWERGAKEAEICGFAGADAWISHIEEMSTEYGFVLKNAGVPIAVFGATRMNGKYYTYFAATDVFEHAGKEATLFLMDFLQKKMAEHPEETLELGSACTHPKAHKWFLRLGFEHIMSKGVYSLYVYRGAKQKLTSR